MSDTLWPQLRLKADTEEERIEAYRKIYNETYVYDERGQKKVLRDWCDNIYSFSERQFEHAFTESENYRVSNGIHTRWSKARLRRILWIKEVLEGSGGTIERYIQGRRTNRSNRISKRRTMVVLEEKYVVVFDDPRVQGKPYVFVTAFPADAPTLKKLKETSFHEETRAFKKEKPQS